MTELLAEVPVELDVEVSAELYVEVLLTEIDLKVLAELDS